MYPPRGFESHPLRFATANGGALARKPDSEWKRKRGWFNRTAEKIEGLPEDLLSGKGALSVARKRELYEKGTPGRATILKAPGERRVSDVDGVDGRFEIRVELPGEDPYELKTLQHVGYWEWQQLQPGAVVEVRVDPGDRERVVLVPPEPVHPERSAQESARFMDSAAILAEGHRAEARVHAAERLDVVAPGSDDPVFKLELELRSERGSSPWRVTVGQRVPGGAEAMVEPGRELQVAYLEVDGGDSVAVDWATSSDGRFA